MVFQGAMRHTTLLGLFGSQVRPVAMFGLRGTPLSRSGRRSILRASNHISAVVLGAGIVLYGAVVARAGGCRLLVPGRGVDLRRASLAPRGLGGWGGEVVALVEVLDESGSGRLPGQ